MVDPLEDDTDAFRRKLRDSETPVKRKHFAPVSESALKQMGFTPFVRRAIPYVVRVVCGGSGGRTSHGSGIVMQYRCGDPPLFTSEDWWLVTNAHVLWCEETNKLEAEAFVEFFCELGGSPVRVDVDLSNHRLLSHRGEDAKARKDALDIAIFR